MKPRTQTVISLAAVTLLVFGLFVLITSAPKILTTDQVKFTPKQLDLENMATVTVQLKLDRKGASVVDQIDNETVVLEGVIPPLKTWVEYLPNGLPTNFFAEFDGKAVKDHVINKLIHMGVTMPHPWNKVNVELTISGELYGGIPWEGTGTVLVYYGDVALPPPPPPP